MTLLLSVIGRLFGKRSEGDAIPLAELPDEELMLKFGKGEGAAFEVLFSRHERGVFRFILRFVSHRDLAEELVQEVFFRVCKVAPSYAERAKFTTWLYTIARNISIDHLRRTSGKTMISLDKPTSDEDARPLVDMLPDHEASMASSEVVRDEFRRHLERALAELPDDQREVFALREFSGLKFKEIAEIVGVSENTIKSRMRYALEALRGHMADYEEFSFDADEAADAQHTR